MFKKILTAGLLITSFVYAQEKKCNLHPIKPMEPIYYGQLLFDRIEYAVDNGHRIDYEITGWYGGDYRKVWLEIEGEHHVNEGSGDIENLDLLYGKAISPFWDFRIGAGYTGSYKSDGGNRSIAVVGIKGLAPYMFEVDTNLRLTTKGEFYGDFEAEYDIWLTQRLALQPKFDTTFSLSKIEEIGIGSGINDINLSLRLRYEVKREIAPYVGISYTRLYGQTKSLAKSEGEKIEYTDIIAGIRIWF